MGRKFGKQEEGESTDKKAIMSNFRDGIAELANSRTLEEETDLLEEIAVY